MMFLQQKFSICRSIYRSFSTAQTRPIQRRFTRFRPARSLLPSVAIASALLLSGCNAENFVTQNVTLKWAPPEERADGSKMSAHDIRGYLIRYRDKNEKRYKTTVVAGGDTTEHSLTSIAQPKNHVFQIATIDALGRYSDFVDAKEFTNLPGDS